MKFIICFYFFTFLLGITTIKAQEFYPMNFIQMIDYNNLSDIKFQSDYLAQKKFNYVNDSLYRNEKTGEWITLTKKNTNNDFSFQIDYYTKANDLTAFINSLKEKKIKKTEPDKFVTSLGATEITFLLAGVVKKDKPYQHIQFSHKVPLSLAKNEQNNFITYALPLQNTTWYFDVKFLEDGGDGNFEHQIFLSSEKIYPYEIKFIDDSNYEITFASTTKKQKLKGTYGQFFKNEYDLIIQQINFDMNKIVRPKKIINGIQEKGDRIYTIKELQTKENLDLYLETFFSKSYEVKFKKTDIELSNKYYMPNTPIAIPSQR